MIKATSNSLIFTLLLLVGRAKIISLGCVGGAGGGRPAERAASRYANGRSFQEILLLHIALAVIVIVSTPS